ncbi:hypothetical protein DF211_01865 [Pectobacterium parmentieri]|nr:hypothetical protein DF211_01865 [Pectobacterium parmentieri]
MSTRKIISDYFQNHNRATFTQLRLHCDSVGWEGRNVAFAINDMIKRGELSRTGNKGSYQYLPAGDLKESIRPGRPVSTKLRIPMNSIHRFDQLLRGVRG